MRVLRRAMNPVAELFLNLCPGTECQKGELYGRPKNSFQHLSEQRPDMCCSLFHAGASGNSLWIGMSGYFLSKSGLYVLLQLGHLKYITLSILYHAPCFAEDHGAFQSTNSFIKGTNHRPQASLSHLVRRIPSD